MNKKELGYLFKAIYGVGYGLVIFSSLSTSILLFILNEQLYAIIFVILMIMSAIAWRRHMKIIDKYMESDKNV